MIRFPNIKINLGLKVINRRTDGFHTIESVFYPINFCDVLEIIENKTANSPEFQFTTTGLKVEGELEDNIIFKAYQLIKQQFAIPPIKVHLHKQIPMGAGLGGGSSDAAYMIQLLNAKFELGLSVPQMETYAAQLGSDCAFFIKNEPAYLLGKGHELEPFTLSLKGIYFVLLNTQVHSSTALAYQHVTLRNEVDPNKSLKNLLLEPIEQWKNTIPNDFEPSVFNQYPQLAQYKTQLYSAGAVYASMSGSGASIFGLFKQKPQLGEELRSLVCYGGWIES